MLSAPGYHATRTLKKNEKARFGSGDVLVLFGELFTRGYANGLVEEAESRGMTIVRATVGRREKDGTLRALFSDEMASIPQPFINIPLEAGFDMEPASDGLSPIERIKDVRLSEWEQAQVPEDKILESRQKGRERFQKSVRAFLKELKPHLPAGKNVLFAHLMAGGVPRAKIIMPLMNRTVKGTGERFLASEQFWNSSLGQLCSMSFHDVTAWTFDCLLQETTELRRELEAQGGRVAYSAYGYHGTEVFIQDQLIWQTYTPYLQGFAKMALEDYSRKWAGQGARTCVFNCPEILTNSSSIFQGVEIPLYPLLKALKKENASSPKTKKVWDDCQALLLHEKNLQQILNICDETFTKPEVKSHCVFSQWPQHNERQQMEKILNASDALVSAHQDPKRLMTAVLSEVVFSAAGTAMLEICLNPEAPVTWLNHDLVANTYLRA